MISPARWFAEGDGLLRGQGRYAVGRGRVPVEHITLLLVACGFLYGAAMGSFGVHPRQMLYSGLKVPLLLAISTCVCLPNFFVLNTLLGLREDFAASIRGVLAAQATVAVALLSLLPVIVFFYASSSDYQLALFTNGVMFFLATLCGQRTLNRHYAPLVKANPRHNIARWSWMVLYIFVAVQLAWVLRPFIGKPGLEVSFFREEAWSNAYVVVLRVLLSLGG